jgi:hypothetical protein
MLFGQQYRRKRGGAHHDIREVDRLPEELEPLGLSALGATNIQVTDTASPNPDVKVRKVISID